MGAKINQVGSRKRKEKGTKKEKRKQIKGFSENDAETDNGVGFHEHIVRTECLGKSFHIIAGYSNTKVLRSSNHLVLCLCLFPFFSFLLSSFVLKLLLVEVSSGFTAGHKVRPLARFFKQGWGVTDHSFHDRKR